MKCCGLVSVIVPVYNMEKYLERCMESIISQSYEYLEIILVDDGSSDNSLLICLEYEKKDYRIKVVHTENNGLSAARNVGIKVCRGDYLAFIDSDDFIKNNFIEKMLNVIIEGNTDMAICNYLEGNFSIFPQTKNKVDKYKVVSSKEFLCNWHSKNKKIETVAWNKLYKKEIFFKDSKKPLYYPINYIHEDVGLTHLLVANSKYIGILSDILYVYYQRKDSISNNVKEKNIYDNVILQKKRMQFFVQNGYKKSYERLYINLCKYYMKMFCVIKKGKALESLMKQFDIEYQIALKLEECHIWEKILIILFKWNPTFCKCFLYPIYKKGGCKK